MNGVVFGETLRRHLTHPAWLSFVALMAIVAAGVARFDHPGSMWPALVGLLAIIAGSGPIGPELSSGTLQLILVKPVKRWVYLVSRVSGVVAAVWIAAGIAALSEVAGRAAWSESPGIDAIAVALMNACADAVLIVSLLTLLGSLTRAYYNVAIYFGLMATITATMGILALFRTSGSALGRFLTEHVAIERSLVAVDRNLFPEVPPGLSHDWLLMVLSNAALALVLACLAFRRREVPYGAE